MDDASLEDVAGEPTTGTYATLHAFVSDLNLGKTEAVMEKFEELSLIHI